MKSTHVQNYSGVIICSLFRNPTVQGYTLRAERYNFLVVFLPVCTRKPQQLLALRAWHHSPADSVNLSNCSDVKQVCSYWHGVAWLIASCGEGASQQDDLSHESHASVNTLGGVQCVWA